MTYGDKLRVIALVLAWVMIFVLVRIDTIDEQQGRTADWRICSRVNQLRAEIHEIGDVENRGDVVRARLPFVNCDPNLEGHGAVPMTQAEAARFLRDYRAGRLDPTPTPP